MSHHFMSCFVTSSHFKPYYVVSHCFLSCHVVSQHFMPCHVVSIQVNLWHVILCHIISCQDMLGHIKSICGMSCCVLLLQMYRLTLSPSGVSTATDSIHDLSPGLTFITFEPELEMTIGDDNWRLNLEMSIGAIHNENWQ